MYKLGTHIGKSIKHQKKKKMKMGTKAKLKTKVFKNRSEIYYNMKNNKQKSFKFF